MTEGGSSQGLFAVVAVVIFGIFVSIRYIIFKVSLKPSLANIFSESIAVSKECLENKCKEIDLQIFEKSIQFKEYLVLSKPKYNLQKITGSTVAGQEFIVNSLNLKKGSKYRISFEFKTKYFIQELSNVDYKKSLGVNLAIYNNRPNSIEIRDGSERQFKITYDELETYHKKSFIFTAEEDIQYLLLNLSGVGDLLEIDLSFKDLKISEIS